MKNATLLLVAVFFSTIYGQQVKYDPETGEPITKEPQVQYDPNTGEPVQPEKQVQYNPETGTVTGSADTLVTTTGKIILGKYLGKKNKKVMFQKADSIMFFSSVKEIRMADGRFLIDTPKQNTFNLKSGDQVTGTILNETTEEITLSHPAMGQITIRRDQIADTGPYRTGSTQYPPAVALSTYQIKHMAWETAELDHNSVIWILVGAVSGVTSLIGGSIGAVVMGDIDLGFPGFLMGGAAGLSVPYIVANQLYPGENSYPPDLLQNKNERGHYRNSYIKKTKALRRSSMIQGPVYTCGGFFLLILLGGI